MACLIANEEIPTTIDDSEWQLEKMELKVVKKNEEGEEEEEQKQEEEAEEGKAKFNIYDFKWT